MVFAFCSDEEMTPQSLKVVEVPPPPWRWWRCLLHPLGRDQIKNLGSGILPWSKYPCFFRCCVERCKLYVVCSFLMPLRGNGRNENSKVSISPLLVINILSSDVVFCGILMFQLAIGKAEKCLVGC